MPEVEKQSIAEKRVIFFDGVCNLCNGFVDFIIRKDKKGQFHFASLQSDLAEDVLGDQLSPSELDSIILWDKGEVLTRSRAVLAIASGLGYPYKALAVTRVLPNFVRDFFYRLGARNRYRIFGKRETCRMPTEEERARILA